MSNNNEIINENLQSSCDKIKKKNILFMVLKKHKIALLLLIFVLLVSTTACWFIFNKVVSANFQAHIKSWNFDLSDRDGIVSFDLNDLYPGVGEIDRSLNITNKGEISGKIKLSVDSIILFGKEVPKEEYEIIPDVENSNNFEIKGFPFSLHVSLGKDSLEAKPDSDKDTTSLGFKLNWDYENNDPECIIVENDVEINKCDLIDTEYGEKSYEFNKDGKNKDNPSLLIKIRISIVQDKN